MKEVGLPEETKIFVTLSLCPYYKIMWSKSQKLLVGKNSVFYIFNSAIRKLHENANSQPFAQCTDFCMYFPAVLVFPYRSHFFIQLRYIIQIGYIYFLIILVKENIFFLVVFDSSYCIFVFLSTHLPIYCSHFVSIFSRQYTNPFC